MNDVYIIDACALIDASKNYNMSKATFSAIWDKLNDMVESGYLFSSVEILDELKDKDLKEWATNNKKAFIPLTEEIQGNVRTILRDYPTMIKIKSTANSNGDPFLIATAMTFENSIIVTNERPGDESTKDYRIPNICKKLDIPCITLKQFLDIILD